MKRTHARTHAHVEGAEHQNSDGFLALHCLIGKYYHINAQPLQPYDETINRGQLRNQPDIHERV